MRVSAVVLIVGSASAFREAVSVRVDVGGAVNATSAAGAREHGRRRHSPNNSPRDAGVECGIPGYLVHEGMRCAGEWIEFWADGDYSLYGQTDSGHDFDQPLECARECNEHAECAGFYSRDGICSYWRSGPLQGATHRPAHGHDCYVQISVEDLDDVVVPSPSPGGGPPEKHPQGPQISDCLCVFDIDRVLTARQGWTQCPGAREQDGVEDRYHQGGTLLLSDMALGIKDSAACGRCYFGLVAHGTASGPGSRERDALDGLVAPRYDVGGYVDGCPSPVTGTKVLACGRGGKRRAVGDIVAWLGANGVHVEPRRVHYFGDRASNIQGFVGGPYHAHQVSCASREDEGGGCGGMRAELTDTPVAPRQRFC